MHILIDFQGRNSLVYVSWKVRISSNQDPDTEHTCTPRATCTNRACGQLEHAPGLVVGIILMSELWSTLIYTEAAQRRKPNSLRARNSCGNSRYTREHGIYIHPIVLIQRVRVMENTWNYARNAHWQLQVGAANDIIAPCSVEDKMRCSL